MYFNPKGIQKKVNWNKKLIFNLQGCEEMKSG